MTSPPPLPVLRQLLNEATELPWLRWHDQEHIQGWDGFLVLGDAAEEGEECNPTARCYIEEDAALILAAVNHLPALLDLVERQAAAIEAVQAVHRPLDAVHEPTGQHRQVCSGCGTDNGNWALWPCPTIRALTASGITPTTEENTDER